MMFKLLQKDIATLIDDAVVAAASNGKEICGFLVDNGYFLEIAKTRNKTRHGGGFSYYLKDVEKLEKAVAILGHKIVGTYHSHPCGIAKPGEADIMSHEINDLLLVIDCLDRTAKLWRLTEDGVVEVCHEVI